MHNLSGKELAQVTVLHTNGRFAVVKQKVENADEVCVELVKLVECVCLHVTMKVVLSYYKRK